MADVRTENEVLRAQLEVLQRNRGMACARGDVEEDANGSQEALQAGTARSGAAWFEGPDFSTVGRNRRTKPSPGKPGKPESSVSKVPASTYKHSCKVTHRKV